MKLEELKPAKGAKKKRKRVGCGVGSGHGKTSCRGQNGQRSRSGSTKHPWFEGGQMPLQRRVPKRGFHNLFKKIYEIVNVEDLKRFPADTEVNAKNLREAGLVKKRNAKVKLLGNGEIDRPVKVTVHGCSKSARERVEKAGGQVQILKR